MPTRNRHPSRSLSSALCLLVAILAVGVFAVAWSHASALDFGTSETAESSASARGSAPTPEGPPKDGVAAKGERVPLSRGLEAAFEATIEEKTYKIRDSGRRSPVPGSYQGLNRAQKLRFGFSGRGVHVRSQDDLASWELDMTLCGIGYGGLSHSVSEGALRAADNRVEYQRNTATGGSLTEWYVNTPRGLEQGFTLPAKPGAKYSPDDRLLVEFQVSGNLRPGLVEDRQSVTFVLPSGKPAVRYSHLHAYDAMGRELPAHMVVHEERIALSVDDRAAEYPVTIDPLFTSPTELTANDGELPDNFGIAVALSTDTAFIGAPGDSDDGFFSGSVYVFLRNGPAWNQVDKLTANDAKAGDALGLAVALDDTTLIVGARGDDHGTKQDAGSAYVFVGSGATWTQQAKLVAEDDAAGHSFGISVALSADTALVGATGDDDAGSFSGAAYVFVRSGTTWCQQAKLVAGDAVASNLFGGSVALAGDTAFIGANGGPISGRRSGSVYVFVRSGTTWTQRAQLKANDAEVGDSFGHRIALNADTLLVGAPFRDLFQTPHGAAYVFVRQGMSWKQQARLTPSDMNFRQFGIAVTLNGDLALVNDRRGPYVFVRTGTTWSQHTRLTPNPTASLFQALALTETAALVGANGTNSGVGAAYLYSQDAAILAQDLIDQVQAANIDQNLKAALAAMLDPVKQVLGDLNESNDVAAVGDLGAFIQAVQAQSGKAISTVEADALIAAAQELIALIQGS